MKKTTILLGGLLMALGFAACSGGSFKKTKSGLLYKIETADKNLPVAKKGDILKVYVVQKTADTTFGTNYGELPIYAPVDSVGPVYNPAEVFRLLRKGDSVTVVMSPDTLMKKGAQLPPFIKRKDKIMLCFRVVDVFTNDSLAQVDRNAEMKKEEARVKAASEGQKVKDAAGLDAYVKKNNLNIQKTVNGVYYEITSTQNGQAIDTGDVVAVKYTGYTTEGKYFDSNMDSTKQTQPHPLTPFEFEAAGQGAIPGMTEAILHFKKGDKGRMLIPSVLAYGANPQPGGPIKPNENLIFDIEVVDVKKRNAAPAAPNAPAGARDAHGH